jgi:hypothetical protein
MPSEQLTADDLLSLCARAHGATGRLTASPASPRLQTLRLLAGFVNDRMTAAALAHEREAVSIEVVHGLQDAVQALVFADLLSHIGVDAGGYIRLDRDGLRPAITPTPAERGLPPASWRRWTASRPRCSSWRTSCWRRTLLTTPDPEMELRSVPDADRAVQMLADSCTAHLRHADGGEVPAEPEQRERGMVWLTFCRRTLERSLAVLETLRDDRDEDVVWAGLTELSRAPGLYRELARRCRSRSICWSWRRPSPTPPRYPIGVC